MNKNNSDQPLDPAMGNQSGKDANTDMVERLNTDIVGASE
jgi:hypothetical protein